MLLYINIIFSRTWITASGSQPNPFSFAEVREDPYDPLSAPYILNPVTAIEFVMFTKSNRSKYSNSFICDDPNCPSPVPFGMRATYLSRYSPYGQTTYIGTSGNRPLFYFDILTTFGIGMITSPTYDWFGNSIRFEGGDALPF